MSVFNPILREDSYSNGLFPSIPYIKKGVATVLTNGKTPPVIVDTQLSTRQIRKGRFNRIVEISTILHSINLNFSVLSKNDPYRFDVTVKINVRIIDPIAFLSSQITDVPEALMMHFSPIIRRISKQGDILDYGSLEALIVQKLSEPDVFDDQSGITYTVIDAEVQPDATAMEYVRQITDHELNTRIERHKADIMAEAISLKEKMKSGIVGQQIDNMREMINFLDELRDKGILSDAEVAENVKRWLKYNNSSFSQGRIGKFDSYELDNFNNQGYGDETRG